MELIWSTNELLIAGRPYEGFPILLWDTMESCIPANDFFRYYLLRGAITSKKSWPSVGQALYDFFSFLQPHELNWRDVERGEAKSIVAAYRDYSIHECGLTRSTVRQRLHFICKFYEYAKTQGLVSKLPFSHEERTVKKDIGYLAHTNTSGNKISINDIMPRKENKLPKYLSRCEVDMLVGAASNPHHRMMIRLALQTGLRREEIATFPIAYIFNPNESGYLKRNIRIRPDPQDGHGMLTKGNKTRDIYMTRRFFSDLYRYTIQIRGERSSLNPEKYKTLFLNQFGLPYASDGKAIRRIVSNIGGKVGLRVHPHMLRHTYATHTLSLLQRNQSGLDPLVFLQRQLGHSSIQTTMVYLHLINEIADSAVLTYDDELNETWSDTNG